MPNTNFFMKRVVAKINDLPTLSQVVSEVLRLLADPTTVASDIENIIEKDPPLATKVLKLINSPYYSLPNQVVNLQLAIGLLGMDTIKHLVLNVSFIKTFSDDTITKLRFTDFWRSSIAVAETSKSISKIADSLDPETLYTAGLLHNIGKIVFAQYFTDDYVRAMQLVEQENYPLFEAEREIFGIDHTLVGKLIADKWNLPDYVRESIRFHHFPSYSLKNKPITFAVKLSDMLVRNSSTIVPWDRYRYSIETEPIELLGLTTEDIDGIIADLPEIEKKVDEFTGIIFI